MKIYCAHRTDVDPPTRIASGSFTKLREMMKKHPGAEFTVVLHDVKPNLENFCIAIVDVTELDAVEATDYRVTDSGHLREAK